MAENRNIFRRVGVAFRSLFYGPVSSFTSLHSPTQADFGVTVTTDAALRFTAVYAAIKLISENIAALPKTVKKESSKGLSDATGHKVYTLLKVQPNEYTDVFTFWFTVIANLMGKGNAYVRIERDSAGFPVALHQLDNSWVRVKVSNGRKFYEVKTSGDSFKFLDGQYQDSDMLHFMLFSLNGVMGIDPISYNAVTIGRGIATQKFGGEFFARGGNIKGVYETEAVLGQEERDALIDYINTTGNFQAPLLDNGVHYKTIGIDPTAAKLIESETLSIQDIARIFSVPPHLLSEMSHSTFSNIEQQNIHFASFTLRPLCKRLEQQLEAKLLTSREQGRYSIKFDLNGLMRGDSASRAAFYHSGINDGWMVPNEARKLEGMEELPGLDRPRFPLNTAMVLEDGTISNPNVSDDQSAEPEQSEDDDDNNENTDE